MHLRRIPRVAPIVLSWIVSGATLALLPTAAGAWGGGRWLGAVLLGAAAGAVGVGLAGKLPRAIRLNLPAVAMGALPPTMVLVVFAGGLGSPAVGVASLFALAIAWRRGMPAGLATAGLALGIVLLGDVRLGRPLEPAMVLAAAALVVAGSLIPVWHARRALADAAEARRQLARVDGYVSTRHPTPHYTSAVPADISRDGSLLAHRADNLMHLESFGSYLRDVRDRTGADEVIYWQYDDARESQRATAWSTEGASVPLYFRGAEWGELVRWSVEGQMVNVDHAGETVYCVAAPVTRDGRELGALTIAAGAGLTLTHDGALEWAARYASHVGVLVELFEIRREYGRQRRRDRAFVRVAEEIQSRRTTEGVGKKICETALELTSGQRAALIQWDARLERGVVRSISSTHTLAERFKVTADSVVGTQCIQRASLLKADARNLSRSTIYGPGESLRLFGSLAVVPMERDRVVVGALVVEGEAPDAISTGEHKNLILLGTIAAASIELFEQFDEATRSSRTDELTGLYNRRHFDDEFKRAFVHAGRLADTTTLVVLDIDHFKRVNDTHGHEAGDAVLRHVAAICREQVRPADICARFGGEEVAILLPRTTLDGGAQLAERLRAAIAGSPARHGGREIPVTASFGVAGHPESVGEQDLLFSAADRALYEAKGEGRNRVKVARPKASRSVR